MAKLRTFRILRLVLTQRDVCQSVTSLADRSWGVPIATAAAYTSGVPGSNSVVCCRSSSPASPNVSASAGIQLPSQIVPWLMHQPFQPGTASSAQTPGRTFPRRFTSQLPPMDLSNAKQIAFNLVHELR